jgi:two-component system response regulator HydG
VPTTTSRSPFELQALRGLIDRACRERALADENALLRRTLHDKPVGPPHPRQQRAHAPAPRLIERFAGAASPVLISGETGTGKELVALAIHADGPRAITRSSRSTARRCPSSCSRASSSATRAARSRARRRRGAASSSRRTAARCSSDEVGDLPQPLQGKLLRVLQSGEVRPLGSEAVRTVDVRCIAATHKDLGQLVEMGLFREDLFFRLDVLRVPVPALHERRDDIPILVDHFLRKSIERSPRSVLAGFEPDAPRPGSSATPGRATCGSSRTSSSGSWSRPRSRAHAADDVKQALGPTREVDPIAALMQKPMTLQELESRYIAAVLQQVGGSKQKAAELLGIDPSTLYRREKAKE